MWDTNLKARSASLRSGFEAGQDFVLALPHGPRRLISENRFFARSQRKNGKNCFLTMKAVSDDKCGFIGQ
jgi:hypothetical protein